MNGKLNLAICISGGGSTMQAVLQACRNGRLPRVRPVLIIASKPCIEGITKAFAEGFRFDDVCVKVRKEFSSSEAFGNSILKECRRREVNVIFQCGFLPTMPPNVVAEYRFKIFNQHPGPLDGSRLGFGGKGMHGKAVHRAVLHFARNIRRPFRTEATVHYVANAVDGGAIVGVRPMELNLDTDTAETLADRLLPQEHGLVIDTLLRLSEFEGAIPELNRHEPLIRDDESDLLASSKRLAIEAYPNG